MTLQIGRAGLVDSLTITGPQDWRVSGRRHRVGGMFASSSLANTKAIRDVLLAQVGEVIPVTYSTDSSFDGFYRLLDADVDARHRYGSLQGNGLFDFNVDLELIGTYSSAEFQGLIDNQLHSNAVGLIASEVNWWHAPPIGAIAYTNGDTAGSTGLITRTGADGDVTVAIGIPDTSPQWTVSPANYYSGGCYVKVGGKTRAGVDVPLDVTDWEIGNSLVKVTPGLTASASNGEIEVAHYDTSAYATAKAYRILYATTNQVVSWSKFRIIKNTVEECVIELVEDANEAGGNKFTRHTLTLGVRRGGLLVYGYHVYDGAAATWTVERVSAEAATAITPTGATGAAAVRATSDDGDGNRYVIGSSLATTQETTQGGLDFSSVNEFDFFISSEIDGSTAQTQDQAGNQYLQYIGVSNEQVRPIPR